MNETIDNILSRRSIRRYQDKPVEQDKIKQILECGQYAPSAKNGQPWHFTVITNRSVLSRISTADKPECSTLSDAEKDDRCKDPDFDFFRGAPMAIIVSGQKEAKYAPADCANAVENMAIAAYSLGLGSCYLASFLKAFDSPAKDKLLTELKIPVEYYPQYALALGYTQGEPRESYPRRENTITHIS